MHSPFAGQFGGMRSSPTNGRNSTGHAKGHDFARNDERHNSFEEDGSPRTQISNFERGKPDETLLLVDFPTSGRRERFKMQCLASIDIPEPSTIDKQSQTTAHEQVQQRGKQFARRFSSVEGESSPGEMLEQARVRSASLDKGDTTMGGKQSQTTAQEKGQRGDKKFARRLSFVEGGFPSCERRLARPAQQSASFVSSKRTVGIHVQKKAQQEVQLQQRRDPFARGFSLVEECVPSLHRSTSHGILKRSKSSLMLKLEGDKARQESIHKSESIGSFMDRLDDDKGSMLRIPSIFDPIETETARPKSCPHKVMRDVVAHNPTVREDQLTLAIQNIAQMMTESSKY
jgi:hypothetical protein